MRDRFFDHVEDEEDLEESNRSFWSALIEHIVRDRGGLSARCVLDIGCHAGGLLVRLIDACRAGRAFGVEPLSSARERASFRLRERRVEGLVVDSLDSDRLPKAGFDLVTCHEVLYLEPSLDAFLERVKRVLAPDGAAYIVLGCHAENPIWRDWKPLIEQAGHAVFDHQPLDIMAAGARQGMLPQLRPLRRDGWITYDPEQARFRYPNARAMMEHHYVHKLLFRFTLK